MKDKKDNGFVVTAHSKIGSIGVYGNVETKWLRGEPVNSSLSTFHRSYTDENGVYRLDGSFADIDQAMESMYRLVGQAVQEMLRKGWVDINVGRMRCGRSRAAVIVTVYGKSEDGTRGWQRSYGIAKDDR